jgi:RNA polymerase sigma-70 factor (ECF subfamily)
MTRDERDGGIGRLYDRFGPALYRYALMILARHDAAEDVVQQVFVGLIRGAPRLDEPERYLRRAVRNACYSRLRAPGSRLVDAVGGSGPPLLELVPDPAVAGPGPEDRIALDAAIAELPPEQREVLHLHVFEGMTFKEVGEATGESANTAASRYRYALERLRTSLSETRR